MNGYVRELGYYLKTFSKYGAVIVGAVGLIGTIVALVSIPAVGIGGALLIGAGTTLGGALVGGVAGSVLGALGYWGGGHTSFSQSLGQGIFSQLGFLVGCSIGAIYGGVKGYDASKNAFFAGKDGPQTSFNVVAPAATMKNAYDAVTNTMTIISPRLG